MSNFKNLVFLFAFLLTSWSSFAQSSENQEDILPIEQAPEISVLSQTGILSGVPIVSSSQLNNNVFIQQVGRFNTTTIRLRAANANLQVKQFGNSNNATSELNSRYIRENVIQVGNFNNIIERVPQSVSNDLGITLQQQGNNNTIQKYGSNSMMDKMKITQTGNSMSITIRGN